MLSRFRLEQIYIYIDIPTLPIHPTYISKLLLRLSKCYVEFKENQPVQMVGLYFA